jgi:hypothetical protein
LINLLGYHGDENRLLVKSSTYTIYFSTGKNYTVPKAMDDFIVNNEM